MLSVLIWLPILGAGAIAFLPKLSAQQGRVAALAIASTTLLWTLWLFTQFSLGDPSFQFREFLPWVPQLGLNYDLGIDSLSLLMLGLNSLITGIALWSSRPDIERPRLFYALMLVVSGGMAGAFVAQNLLLFFLLYELELVPLYLLVAIWGGEKRNYAATKFLLYTALSGALMLAGFLATVLLTGNLDFAYEAGLGQALPLVTQVILLGILLVAFGIKIPLVAGYLCSSVNSGGNYARWGACQARHLRIISVWIGHVPRGLVGVGPLSGGVGSRERALWGGDGDRPKRHQADGGL